MTQVYVTGHRSPDLDSIAAAIGYAELMQRLHPKDVYTPVRLGEINPQTAWALERSGAERPELLPHIRLRVCDVMHQPAMIAGRDDPVRRVGLAMAERGLDIVPVVGYDGALAGMVTEGDLARLYIRESRGASSFAEAPAAVQAIVDVLEGRLLAGEPDRRISGRLWVVSMGPESMGSFVGEGDIAVVGDRTDAQRRAVELGVAALVLSNGVEPGEDVLALAAERDTVVIGSPLDSYVTGRMIRLAEPCGSVMSRDPLTVTPDELLADVTPQLLDVTYRAAIAVDEHDVPIALVTRSDLVNPEPRHVILVDHAEQAQSVPGVEEAEIVEILDHHHIGSIETRVPVRATFDPVGSSATLVVERFRVAGREPRAPTATMLLAGILSDTVILTSPTTTDRDLTVVEYLEELLALDAREFGMEMFEASSDVSGMTAEEIIGRDAKEYEVGGGRRIVIAQIETVGAALADRHAELREALEARRRQRDYALAALMLTNIVERGSELLVAGDTLAVERSFGKSATNGAIPLPGVMSRKKQVAPKLLAAL